MARFGIKCTYDGITFASEPERDFYIKLVELKKQGKIKDFIVQPNYPLQEEFTTEFDGRWDNVKIQPISITPDYHITLNDGNEILLDTKGANCIEEDSQLRRKMFLYQYKSIPLFFIGQLPIYLGNKAWVDVTKGQDFLAKLKSKYNKIYPNAKKSRTKPVNWKVKDWDQYFEYENVDGLFYRWIKTKMTKKKG